MAPTVVNQATSFENSSTTPLPVTMPASIVAGRLLLAFCSIDGLRLTPTASGWLLKGVDGYNGGTLSQTIAVFARAATGGDSMSLVPGASETHASVVYQIDGWSGDLAKVFVAVNALLDPPTLAPADGSQDYLWFAAAASSITTVTGAPTNYTNLQAPTSGTTLGGSVLGVAQRALTAASENPGTFTGGGSNGASATVAVAPAAAASGPEPGRRLLLAA